VPQEQPFCYEMLVLPKVHVKPHCAYCTTFHLGCLGYVMSSQVYFDNSKETQAISCRFEQCPLQQDLEEVPTAGKGDNNQCKHAALPHEVSAARQPSVPDAAEWVPKKVTKLSLINAEGARPRSSSSKHNR